MPDTLAIDGGTPIRTEPFPKRMPYNEREEELVLGVIRAYQTWGGPVLREFQEKFAEKIGLAHSVTASSGTAALHIAIGGLDPSPGDEIITTPITDFGSVVGIIAQNAVPVFADVDPHTWCLDPKSVEANITDRTRAIMPVHLFGNACDIEAIVEIAKRHNLMVIEDCSQSHFTKYKGKYLGTFGDVGCFSLMAGKQMACGDGGIVVTNNEEIAKRMAMFGDKGYDRDNNWSWGARAYPVFGLNYRMTTMVAALGLAQLEKIDDFVARRHAHGTRLSDGIRGIDGLRPAPVTEGCEHSYWSYTFEVTGWDPETFGKALTAEGIPAGTGYTKLPIYMCAACLNERKIYGDSAFPLDSSYTDRNDQFDTGLCPIADEVLPQMINVTMHEDMKDSDIDDTIAGIRKVAMALSTV